MFHELFNERGDIRKIELLREKFIWPRDATRSTKSGFSFFQSYLRQFVNFSYVISNFPPFFLCKYTTVEIFTGKNSEELQKRNAP